jgi:hypothetical protein
MPVETMDVAALHVSREYQARDKGVCEDTVKDYTAAAKAGAKFPPLVAYRVTDRKHKGPALVAGFHREAAFRAAGVTRCEVDVREGTFAEAWLAGFTSNLTNALRYSNADKRRAAERALTLFTGDSNRQLAERMGLSHDFITRVRRELEATGVIARVEKVAGKDGREQASAKEDSNKNYGQVSSDDTCLSPMLEDAADDDGGVEDFTTVESLRHMAQTAAADRDFETAAEYEREADDLEARIEANGGNPVPVEPDPNDPTEDRGDAWEPPDEDELSPETGTPAPEPMDESLPVPARDASKPGRPAWMTGGSKHDPDHPFADVLAKFTAATAALTKAINDPKNERLKVTLTNLSTVVRKTQMVDYAPTVIAGAEVRGGRVRFVGLAPLRTLVRKLGNRQKAMTVKEILGALNETELEDCE